jgi:hypothetical protein
MTVGMFFLFTAFYLLLPTLPQFIKQMGGNEAQVGLAAGAFMLSAVIFRPIVGGLLDRFGRRPFIVWGLLLFILAMYMYNWIGGIVVLMGLRILHGISWAVSTTAIITAVTDMIPSARRGEGMGWFGMAMTLAMANRPDVRHLGYTEPIVPRSVSIRRRSLGRSAALDVWCKNAFPAAIGRKENRIFRKIGLARHGIGLFSVYRLWRHHYLCCAVR